MTTAYDGHVRFSTALAVKGAFMIALGVAALAWSDAALLNAMLLASFVLAVLGVYEIVVGVRARRLSRGWPVPIADGAASVGLAVLGVTITAVSLRATTLLAALWLGASGIALTAFALALWPSRRARVALLAWAGLDLLLAGMALASQVSLFTVMYVGAGYAIAYGSFQFMAGAWVWSTAAPEVAPTRQSGWRAAG